IAVTPGQTVRVAVDAFYLGSALDGTLLVYDPTGKKLLAQNNDEEARGNVDPALQFTVPEGTHEAVVSLRDAFGRGGLEYPYRLTIEPGGPDFYLALGKETFRQVNDKSRLCDAEDTLNLVVDKPVKFPITVRRSTKDAPYYR